MPAKTSILNSLRGVSTWRRRIRLQERSGRVHALYKRPEIPANSTNPAFAVSVTYWKRKKAANTGSTPVSATKPFKIIGLQ
jgi:hypothetical protein